MRQYPVMGIRSTENDWQRCIHIFLRERAGLRISDEMGIGHCRAARMAHALRMIILNDIPDIFAGPVELDETYIGGQRKNKRLHIRRIRAKRGHGTEKLSIVGIFDRASGQVYVETMMRKLDINHIFSVLKCRAVSEARVFTDGFKMYRGMKEFGWKHEYVDHDDGEYVRGDVHTNNIEGFWGILKRKLSCIGGMRRNRLHLFAAEIVWKFNHRKLTLAEQERQLLDLVIEFGGRNQ